MVLRQPKLPLLWLLSDARNDARLEAALRAMPPGSGFVFRHYHLAPEARRRRFEEVLAHSRLAGGNHLFVLAGTAAQARDWGAQGVYGNAGRIALATGLVKLATAHDSGELAAAARAGADGAFLSPVFATRSHPGAATLGIDGFHVLARQSSLPVIALGGMTAERAAQLDWPRWGAIDGIG